MVGVRFSLTSTVMLLLPTMRKGNTRNLKFSRVFVMEKKRKSLPLEGFALFIHPYDKYFNIKSHNFMSNQRICGWIDSNDEFLLTEISLSALIIGISALLSAVTSPTTTLS